MMGKRKYLSVFDSELASGPTSSSQHSFKAALPLIEKLLDRGESLFDTSGQAGGIGIIYAPKIEEILRVLEIGDKRGLGRSIENSSVKVLVTELKTLNNSDKNLSESKNKALINHLFLEFNVGQDSYADEDEDVSKEAVSRNPSKAAIILAIAASVDMYSEDSSVNDKTRISYLIVLAKHFNNYGNKLKALDCFQRAFVALKGLNFEKGQTEEIIRRNYSPRPS